MSEIQPVLKEFVTTIKAAVVEASHSCTPGTIELVEAHAHIDGITFKSVEDINLYNAGVVAGATQVVDTIHDAGYVITDKEGTVVKTEANEAGEAQTFSQTFFATQWESPSN